MGHVVKLSRLMHRVNANELSGTCGSRRRRRRQRRTAEWSNGTRNRCLHSVFYLKTQEKKVKKIQVIWSLHMSNPPPSPDPPTSYMGWSAPIDLNLHLLHTLSVLLSFGALGTLGTGGAADRLVVGVDAEPGLHHHHTVVMFVSAVFVWNEDWRTD